MAESNTNDSFNDYNETRELDLLKADLIALKLFVKDQFFIMKKSLEAQSNTGKEFSISVYIDDLKNQIEYLKFENKTKSEIVHSLLSSNTHRLNDRSYLDSSEYTNFNGSNGINFYNNYQADQLIEKDKTLNNDNKKYYKK